MNSVDTLMQTERGYPDRINIGLEAISVLREWYSKLNDLGYYIKKDELYRTFDNKRIALIHDIPEQRISVLPYLSWD